MFNRENIKDVISLALPAVGEMILYMMIWVFDTMMVGKFGGKIAVSTVGLSSEIMYTFVNIFISVGISVGVTSLVARKYGAKEFGLAEEYASAGLIIGFLLSLTIAVIAFLFSPQILTFAGAKNEVLKFGVLYMKITSIGMFFNMLMNVLNSLLRGYGNTKTPLVVSIIINIINLSLDYILIFGKLGFPSLGIKGAAIATSTAYLIGFVFISIYTVKHSKIKPRKKYILNISWIRLKELLKLSIPSSMQEGAFSISRLISTFMIMHIGEIAFAANQITTTIESVSFMPGFGFAVASTTLVGHKIGEKNYKKANEYAFTCTALGAIAMSICSVIFLLFPNFLIRLFIKGTELDVIRLGASCLMIASLEQPFMGASMILGGALKGSGDTKTPFIISALSSWLIRLPLMYYFIYILKLSVVYVWWITAVQWIFDGILILFIFKKRANKLITNS